MYVNKTNDQYEKYFDAYKAMAIGIAKLMIRENNQGNAPNDTQLNAAWETLLQIETKIAKVCVHQFLQHNYFLKSRFYIYLILSYLIIAFL